MGGRPSPPQVDYAAIARQQEQERQRLQGIEDEKYRVKGITDYIDYMSDNPKSMSFQAATGRYFKGVSPGATPGKALENYQTDKSINVDMVKQDPSKYFDRKTSQASIQPGRIRFGKLPDKSAQEGLLGTGEQDKKTLLGA
jgi:hypothetical protein